MLHTVAPSTTRPHRSGQGPRSRHRLTWALLGLACAVGLWIGPPDATAVTRHSSRAHDAAAPSTGHTANPSTAGDSHTPVWRCKDALGTTRYSQHPCEGGTALTHLADPRTTAQREQAADMQARDGKLLRHLGRERHHQEVLARDQGHGSLGPKHPRHVAASTPGAHAPVPLQRCRPPSCFTARLPKDKSAGKAASPATPSASS
jgi:hypothetical protein